MCLSQRNSCHLLTNFVASGGYSTPEDVVRDALVQMRDRRAKFEALKPSLDEAAAEIGRGEGVPFDVDEILREGRRIYASSDNRTNCMCSESRTRAANGPICSDK
jgi:Arc/MetJ-type ribon-helix-helix transcriptional regulator